MSSETVLLSFDAAVRQVDGLLTDAVDGGVDASALEGSGAFGRYEGTPAQIELDDDGRSARLLREITFYSPEGSKWFVPVNAWLDGASIPRALWTIIGAPFEGKYRAASIVHDHFCITKDRSWRDTHRMFYDAMRCSGVAAARATVMYYAVYRYGPRWTDSALESEPTGPDAVSGANAASFRRDAERIILEGLGPDAARALADAQELNGSGPHREGPA